MIFCKLQYEYSDDKKGIQEDLYWKKIDELYASAEKKNLLKPSTDPTTEKFHLFTTMLRSTIREESGIQ